MSGVGQMHNGFSEFRHNLPGGGDHPEHFVDRILEIGTAILWKERHQGMRKMMVLDHLLQ